MNIKNVKEQMERKKANQISYFEQRKRDHNCTYTLRNHPTVNLNLSLLRYHAANYYINNLGNNTSKIHVLLFSKQETATFDTTD